MNHHDCLARNSGGRAKQSRAPSVVRANEIQLLVNQEARAVTGCFRTTNLGTLAMESGLRPAAAQLENRLRRYVLRLLSLPQGSQAKEVVGAGSATGKRLERALGYAGRMETRSY
jgi:hypothetical protein